VSTGRVHERVGFALAGGATRGAAQVGMLVALTEAGIRPDLIVGTSIGALNGACYSQDPTLDGLDHLASLWMGAPRSQIFPLSPRTIAQNVWQRSGYVLDNQGLREWIRASIHHDRLEHFPIPLHAVATDARTGCPVVLSKGDSVQALLATSAIPGVFPSVVVGDTELHDGAVSANTPLSQAVALGATRIYVLPTSPADSAPTSPLWQLLDRLFGRPAAAEEFDHPPDVTVHWLPAPRPADNPVSFRASRRLIAEARSLAHHSLAQDAASTAQSLRAKVR
jgi:NTE family protein